jgi:Putative Flp pilus-assembly TadE/G-like
MKSSFEAFGLRWSRTRERGATAVVVALCLLLVVGAAAMSFDIANLALKRQTLQNLTDAAAQAGAVYLRDNPKDLTGAQQAAFKFAHDVDATFILADVTLWCIVSSTGATKDIAPGNIGPGLVCNPLTTTGKVCDLNLCAIPCTASGASCNAIQVKHGEDVPFYFAPAIGIPKGSTGAVASVSCAKSCGSGGIPNPMDVAIIADRTPSMSDQDFGLMQSGIYDSLTLMTPEYQFVTLGTIHRSHPATGDTCPTHLGPAVSATGNPATYPYGGGRLGKWMPLGFSNDYLLGPLGTPGRTQNGNSALVKGLNCMDHHDVSHMTGYPWNTHLAAPLKAAARALLEKDPPIGPSLTTMSVNRNLLTKNAPVSKWIIFETDGQPQETIGQNTGQYRDSQGSSDTSVDSSTEPSVPGDALAGCTNLINVAKDAKLKGINIIMIAYGSANTSMCGTRTVGSFMAEAASPKNFNLSTPSVVPADKSCATANSDGDFYFCATTGNELKDIFKTAIGMASLPNTKYVRMPS